MLYRQSVLSLYKGNLVIFIQFNIKNVPNHQIILKFIIAVNFRKLMQNLLISEFLRYSKNLQHTDKEYFLRKVKEEFIKNKEISEKEIPYCIRQGKVFLLSRNVV